ncbi:MAG: inositol-3-phosphate synthase [Chloroflexi bacterium]|nr:inositol-3-phosphate synthase [Chloroflexota bacterium]
MSTRTGVLFIGAHGSVATTTVAGIMALARGLSQPYGTITTSPLFEGIDLLSFGDLAFGGWDIHLYERYDQAVRENGVVPPRILDLLRDDLASVLVFPGILTHLSATIRELGASTPEREGTARRAVEQIQADIARFRQERDVERVIVVNTSSTEQEPTPSPSLATLEGFEAALDADAPELTNGMLYGYAALTAGCPFVNFTPSVTVEIPALQQLARQRGLPLAGQDGKTGQTLYKTVLAPMLRIRGLRLRGWYSTNILGNADGFVLNDPLHGATKIHSKESVLESILGYADFAHRVRIDYYPPRGDHKEAWDSVDFEGWLGEPMSMRIDWQGSDSTLAAPLIADLIRLIDLARRSGEVGPVVPLAMFFKSPYGTDLHDFFAQYQVFEQWVGQHRADAVGSVGTPSHASPGGTSGRTPANGQASAVGDASANGQATVPSSVAMPTERGR